MPQPPETRATLIQRLPNAADVEAWDVFVEIYEPLLFRLARGREMQPADAEDLVQDILLSVHAARRTYDPARPFRPWLSAIVRNRMADAARQSIRQRPDEATAAHLAETFSIVSANGVGDDYGDSEALRRAIADLPTGQRRAVELLKLHELSLREAAALSGMSTGALKVAVHRGIRTLRMKLTREA